MTDVPIDREEKKEAVKFALEYIAQFGPGVEQRNEATRRMVHLCRVISSLADDLDQCEADLYNAQYYG